MSRIFLTKWLFTNTSGLVLPLTLATVFRIAQLVLNGVLLALPASALAQAALNDSGFDLLQLLILMTVTALAKALLRYLEQYCGHKGAFLALAELRNLFFTRIAPQAPALTEGSKSGELAALATADIDRVEVFFAHTVPPALAAVATSMLMSLAALLLAGPRAGLIVAAVCVLMVFVVPLIGGSRDWKLTQQLQSDRSEIAQQLTENFQGLREVLDFSAEASRLEELDQSSHRVSAALRRLNASETVRETLNTLVYWGGFIALLAVAALAENPDAVPGIITVLALYFMLPEGVRAVEEFIGSLNASFASAERLHTILSATPAVTNPPVTVRPRDSFTSDPVAEKRAVIRFQEVTFSYPEIHTLRAANRPAGPALSNISFTITEGSTTGFAGLSGSGKSTAASLMLRFWDPDQGDILFQEKPLRNYQLSDVRSNIAYLTQRPHLFRGTLRSNLLMANPQVDSEQISQALYTADLEEFVAQLPRGLDTPLGERGARLSGGQAQRLALARILLKDPQVVVLDEATSQLDEATESRVRKRFAEWSTARTVIEISHRLEWLEQSDHLIVMSQGQVAEQGSPEELSKDSDSAWNYLKSKS